MSHKEAALEPGDIRRNTPIKDTLDEVKAKLLPGDILVSKRYRALGTLVPTVVEKVTSSPWTHAGIYLGDNRVGHLTTPIVKPGRVSKLRSRLGPQ